MERARDVMMSAATIAHEAATHDEMKPENDKDTRGIEAGYLAQGQSARAAEIDRSLRELSAVRVSPFAAGEAVAVGALVVTESEDGSAAAERRAYIFVAPAGGGVKIKLGAINIQVVTPSAPLGDALMGKRAGDIVEVAAGGKKREIAVVSVS
jgi:transcription elongation GreA/GreB family factor